MNQDNGQIVIEESSNALTDKQFEKIKANLALVCKNNDFETLQANQVTMGIILTLEALGIDIPPYWPIAVMSGRCIIDGLPETRESWDTDSFMILDEFGEERGTDDGSIVEAVSEEAAAAKAFYMVGYSLKKVEDNEESD